MSLNVAMNVALSGLFANQRAIGATSENIANVNTADFSRREARFTADSLPDQFAGVSVEIVRAASNDFLRASNYASRAEAAGSELQASALGNIEATLGSLQDNTSFSNLLDEAFAAIVRVSADPSSIAAKADALARLDDAFSAFGRTLNAIESESEGAQSQLQTGAARVNTILEDIYKLNQVAPSSNGARDQIEARLGELSQYMSFSVSRGSDGRVSVLSNDGSTLADSANHGQFAFDGTGLTLASVDGDTGIVSDAVALATNNIGSGQFGALISLINDELPRLEGIVGGAARAVATELNTIYAGNVVSGAATTTTDTLIVETGGRFSVNASLMTDPARFAVARPPVGVSAGITDGTGAAALLEVSSGAGIRDSREAIALIGSAARNAELSATSARLLAEEVSIRLSDSAGVNLDEELSNLIVLQRSYGANARVISAVDEMWQSLLNIL